MTLKFIDGFESYDNAADMIPAFPGTSNSGTITFPTTGRRSGTKCFQWDAGLASGTLRFPVDVSTFEVSEYAIIGFAFKVIEDGSGYDIDFYLDNGSSGDGGGMAFSFKNNTTTIAIKYCRQFGTTIIDYITYELNQWNYLEVKVKIGDGTDGHIVARLNEQEIVNWTGDNRHSGTTGLQVSRFYAALQRYWDISIDDFYIAGGNGSYNNDFLGDVRIDVINPNGAGNYTQLTPSAGNNYECVDEGIIDESDYVEGANAAEKDSYSYADVPTDLDDVSIFGICLRNISQRTAGSDNIKIDALVRTGSTDYNSASEVSLTDTWSNKDFMFEKDPSDSGDWTQAKINACEFGMEVA
jgi:hypothetical protein